MGRSKMRPQCEAPPPLCVLVCAEHRRYVLGEGEDTAANLANVTWLHKYPPVARAPLLLGGKTLREETLLQMRVHGIEAVRSSAIPSVNSPATIAHEMATLCFLCTRCGSSDHLVHECSSTRHVVTHLKLPPRAPPRPRSENTVAVEDQWFELDVHLQAKGWRLGAKGVQDIRTMARTSIEYALYIVREESESLNAQSVENARKLFQRHTRLIQRILREPNPLHLTVASRLLLKQYELLRGKPAYDQLLQRAENCSPRTRNKFIVNSAE